jgi:proline iminopeptidase
MQGMGMMNKENDTSIEPKHFVNGLAVYDMGDGIPVLLEPYPHGYTLCSIAASPLANILLEMGLRVITFDPPGTYQSQRMPLINLDEMIVCTQEALDSCGIDEPVTLVGHSMGSLCALAFSIAAPERVKRMVLIGSAASGTTILKRGMPHNWIFLHRDYWRYILWGWKLMRGRGNLALHKQHHRLINRASFHDKSKMPVIPVLLEDELKPAPLRDQWAYGVPKMDFKENLTVVKGPTLLMTGRYDPQTPVVCAEELAAGLPRAEMVIFEKSGHSPFIEEEDRFKNELVSFLELKNFVQSSLPMPVAG